MSNGAGRVNGVRATWRDKLEGASTSSFDLGPLTLPVPG
jgi:hypothetical protein